MAKKTAAPADTADTGVVELSAKTEKLIDAVKAPFTRFVKGFAALEQKRTDLAPQFMQAANAWMGDSGMGFIDFVRHLIPEVGATAAEYNAHPAYNAARYLKRKAEQMARAEKEPETPEQRATRQATAPAAPMTAVSRLIASFLEFIPQNQVDKLRQAMRTELHWADRRVDAIFADATEKVDPLVVISTPKGTEMPHIKLSFPATNTEAKSEAA